MYKSIITGAAIALMGFAALKTINDKKISTAGIRNSLPGITLGINDTITPVIPANVGGYKGLTITKMLTRYPLARHWIMTITGPIPLTVMHFYTWKPMWVNFSMIMPLKCR